jgi:dipeptidyl aminopeptidase/acylaminoacyl peptidase
LAAERSVGADYATDTIRTRSATTWTDISAVDAAIATGSVDPDQLYVTGGSGGGVLTAWIVGHTHRFRAAAT